MADKTEPSPQSAPSEPILSASVDKVVHSLVVDAGPLIKNDPPVSTLLGQAEEIVTIPAVLEEIRDAATRSRVETMLLPFLTLRNPKPGSIKAVTDFARKTGDLEVLSRTDLQLIALCYELECERNGGDWRLRKEPGQGSIDGEPPLRAVKYGGVESAENELSLDASFPAQSNSERTETNEAEELNSIVSCPASQQTSASTVSGVAESSIGATAAEFQQFTLGVATTGESNESSGVATEEARERDGPTGASDSDSDSDGWITPSSLQKHTATETLSMAPASKASQFLQVALITSDFAMQNVSIRMGLNIMSPTMYRITQLRTFVLRCHGCFAITRDMTKQFCPRCGQPTLIRTSCSTDENGTFQVHLKKNFQWNNRGNVYSVPRPVHGSASGKLSKNVGGGKNGWGRNLIFAEDQREYVKAMESQQRVKQRDLMDEDYLPSIIGGDRHLNNGRIRIGAGRSINSKKRTF